jgi:hypothetical protein
MNDHRQVPIDAAGEHYVLYLLYRQGIDAALLPPRTPIGDIVLFDRAGGIGGMVQVKTSRRGRSGWVMGAKNEVENSPALWYALVDMEEPLPSAPSVYLVPSKVVSDRLRQDHTAFLARGGKDNPVRKLKPGDWLMPYREAWASLPGYGGSPRLSRR